MTAPLQLIDVRKRYGAVQALDGVSLQVHAGELVALLGASGAGKSTVFRCLSGLARPDTGAVHVHGQRIDSLRGQALRSARRGIGLVFQQHNLIGRLPTIDNVLLARLADTPLWRVLARRFRIEDRQRALAVLDQVGLLDKAYVRADALSGGQQQRVAIARVLAQQGGVLLADEPVASLDPESAARVMDTLRNIAHQHGIAVLCSLHQVDFARSHADRLVGLRAGQVVFEGCPGQLDRPTQDALYAAPRAQQPAPLVAPVRSVPDERRASPPAFAPPLP